MSHDACVLWNSGRLGTPTHAGACPQVVRAGFYGAKGDKPPTRPGDGPNWLDQANEVGASYSYPRENPTPTRCLAALASLFPCCRRCGMVAHHARLRTAAVLFMPD